MWSVKSYFEGENKLLVAPMSQHFLEEEVVVQELTDKEVQNDNNIFFLRASKRNEQQDQADDKCFWKIKNPIFFETEGAVMGNI